MTLTVLDEKNAERLAKAAYEAFTGIRDKKDNDYFINDSHTWEELPYSTRAHWISMIDVIFLTLGEMDKEQE